MRLRDMGLAVLAFVAVVLVSVLMCQFLIVAAAAGGRKRAPGPDAAEICQPSIAIAATASSRRGANP
jgi:hypothetical protein